MNTASPSVLVANRGEVAVRILRALRDLGLHSVAICTPEDRMATHVRRADEVVILEDAPRGYLDIDAVIQAARTAGAQALHPGYGFLAESPALRDACDAADIRFVGPSAATIRLMADKLAARQAMADAGIPVVPGSTGAVADADAARAAAEALGFPVLLKAAAGGGGRGMRRVEAPGEVAAAFDAATREATGAFGCGTLFVEKCLVGARHIEVQVLADGHGNAVHLYERACSVQRRHQKIIEEAPAPRLSQETAQALYGVSLDAVAALGYDGAGTMEFLVDRDERFHFLEMNTRLQVEHAVTEMLLGIDLVQEMIRVGLGAPLSWRQQDLVPRGHAIQCRVYAEDPYREFAPSPGHLFRYRPPAGPFIRVDDGVEEGVDVCACFDPLMAKVISWARDRPGAVARMRGALKEFEIGGIRHNLPLLAHVLDSDAFASGAYDTGLIDAIGPTPPTDVVSAEELAAAAVAVAMCGPPPPRQAPAPTVRASTWRARRIWRGLD